jgi:hypothetical protein
MFMHKILVALCLTTAVALAQFPPSGGGGGAGGAVTVTSGTIGVQGIDPGFVLQTLKVDGAGNLLVSGQTATSDCSLTYSSPLGTSGNSANLDNRNNSAALSSCRYWVVMWNHPDTTSTTVTLQTAPDAAGIPGTFVSTGLTPAAQGYTQSATETLGYGATLLSGYVPWLRLSYTSTVATNLEVRLFGWRAPPSEIFQPVTVQSTVGTPDCSFSTTFTGTAVAQSSATYSNAFQSATDPRGCTFWRLSTSGANNGNLLNSHTVEGIDPGPVVNANAFYRLDTGGVPLIDNSGTGGIRFARYQDLGMVTTRSGLFGFRITSTSGIGVVYTVRMDGWRTPPFPVVWNSLARQFRYATAGSPSDAVSAAAAVTTQDIVSTSAAGANGQAIITGTPTAASFATATLAANQTARIQVTGTWTGTLQAEVSFDSGVTWVPTSVSQTDTVAPALSFTNNFVGSVNAVGATNVRVRATAPVTGSASVLLIASYAVVADKMPIVGGKVQVGAPADGVATPTAITTQDAVAITSAGANGQVFLTGGALTANSFAQVSLIGNHTTRVQASGTWTGSLTVEQSIDNGVRWTRALAVQEETFSTDHTFTQNFTARVTTIGSTQLRVRSTAVMTGTANVSFVPSYQTGPQVLPIIGGKVQVSTASASDSTAGPTSMTLADIGTVSSQLTNGKFFTTGSAATAGSEALFALASVPMIQVQTTGNMIGTAVSEISYDGGVRFYPAMIQQPEVVVPFSTWTGAAGTQMNLAGIVNTTGATHYRIRITSFTSGTLDASIVKTAGVSSVSVTNLPLSSVNSRVLVDSIGQPDTSATVSLTAQDIVSTSSTGANGQVFTAGSPTAGSAMTLALSSISSVRVQATGTWTGNLRFETSIDNGVTWTPAALTQIDTSVTSNDFTANFSGYANVAGLTDMRVRSTAAMTGTAVISVIRSYQSNPEKLPIVGGLVQVSSSAPAPKPDCSFTQSFTSTGVLVNGTVFDNSYQSANDPRGCVFWRVGTSNTASAAVHTTTVLGVSGAGAASAAGLHNLADGLAPSITARLNNNTYLDFAVKANSQSSGVSPQSSGLGINRLRVDSTMVTVGVTYTVTMYGWRQAPVSVSYDESTGQYRYASSKLDVSNGSAQITTEDLLSTSSTGANGQVFITGVETAGSAVQLALNGQPTVGITSALPWVGTVQVETQTLTGVWTPAIVTANDGSWSQSVFTQNFSGTVNTAGASAIRVRAITAISISPVQITFTRTFGTAPQTLPILGGKVQVSSSAPSNSTAGPLTMTAADIVSVTATGSNGQSFVTGTPTAGSTASFVLASIPAIEVHTVGTLVGTVVSEVSYDSGLTWYAAPIQLDGQVPGTSTLTGTAVPQLIFAGRVNTAGATNYRVRTTAFTSGALDVSIVKTSGPATISLSNLPTTAGGTPAVSSDPAVTVALRNVDVLTSSVAITTQDIVSTSAVGANGQTFVSGAATAASTVATAMANPTAVVQVKGTWTGSLQVEVSYDNGVTWTSTSVSQTETIAPTSQFTGNFLGRVSTIGATNLRVRAIAAMTGSALVTITKTNTALDDKLPVIGGLVQVSSAPSAPAPDCSTTYTFTGTGAVVNGALYDNAFQAVSDRRGCTFWRMSFVGANTAGSHTTVVEGQAANGTFNTAGTYSLVGGGQPTLAGTLITPSYIDWSIQPSTLGFAINKFRVNSTAPVGVVYTIRVDGWRTPHTPVSFSTALGQFRYAQYDQYSSSNASGAGTRPISNQQNTLLAANEALCRDAWNPGAGGGTVWGPWDNTIDRNSVATSSSTTASMRGCRYWQVSIPAQASGTSDALTGVITVEASNDATTWRTVRTYKFNAYNRYFSFASDSPYLRASTDSDPSLATWAGFIEISGYRQPPTNGKDTYVTGLAGSALNTNLLQPSATVDAVDLGDVSSQAVRAVHLQVKVPVGVTAGQFLIEGSNDNASFQPLPVKSFTTDSVQTGAFTLPVGSYFYSFDTPLRYVRARITVAVAGGTAQMFVVYSGTSSSSPVNAPANLSQVSGANTDTDEGPPSSGTLRVVLADRGLALTTVVAVNTQDTGSTVTTGANGQAFITGTADANSFADVSGFAKDGSLFAQVTGTWTGTLVLEGTFDNTTWVRLPLHQVGTSVSASSFTGNFAGFVNVSGMTRARVRATAAMTGTAGVQFAVAPTSVIPTIQNDVKVSQNNPAVPLTVQQTDGVNDLVLIPPSTTVTSTDVSVPVAISPNSIGGVTNLPLYSVQGDYVNGQGTGLIFAADVASVTSSTMFGQTLVTGTPTANSSSSFLIPPGSPSVGFRLSNAGPFVASLVVEGRHGGNAWIRLPVLVSGATLGEFVSSGPFTTFTLGTVNTVGLGEIRLRATSYTSGTVNLTWYTSPSQGQGPISIANPSLRDSNNRQEVVVTPTSASANALVPVSTTALASFLVLKASAGNLYSLHMTVGATAGFLMLFNSTTAPADGAVTPVHCIVAPANQTTSLSHIMYPASFSTGITAVFSSTGCFTKTASASAFFGGQVK